MKYKVLATFKSGAIVNYTYEGDGEHEGQLETALERAKRHMIKNKSVVSYEIKEIKILN